MKIKISGIKKILGKTFKILLFVPSLVSLCRASRTHEDQETSGLTLLNNQNIHPILVEAGGQVGGVVVNQPNSFLDVLMNTVKGAEKIGQGKSNHFSASGGTPAPVYYTRGLTDALLRGHFPKDVEEGLASKSIWKNYANEIATGIMLSTLALIAIVNYGIPYLKIKLAKRKHHKLLLEFKEKLFTDLKIFSNLEIVVDNNELVIQTKEQANKVNLNKDNNKNAVLDARKFFNSLKNELGNQGYLPYQITVTKNHLFIRNLTQELLNETQSIDVEPLTNMFIDAPAKTSEEHSSDTKQAKDTTTPSDSSVKANDSDKKTIDSVNSGKHHAKGKNILTQYASATQRNSGVKSKSAISVKKKHR